MTSMRDTLLALESVLASSGYITGGVEIGEPKSAPADWTGAVILGPCRVQALTLGTPIEERTLLIRVYASLDHADREHVELRMLDAYQKLKALFDGDYDLSGFGSAEIRDVHPAAMDAEMGYQNVGGTEYRLLDMALSLIVDDAAVMAA